MGSPDRQLIDIPISVFEDSCDQTFLSSHYKAEMLSEKLNQHPSIQVLHETLPLGNAGSFLEHYETFSELDLDGHTIIIPSDPVIEGLSVEAFKQAHIEHGANVTVAGIQPKDYGLYVNAKDGRVTGYTKEDDPDAASTIGIYMIRNQYLLDWAWHQRREARNGRPQNITYDLVDPEIKMARAAVFLLAEDSYWDDAGTHDRYHFNNMRLSNGENVLSSDAQIDPDAQLERCIILGGVTLDASTRLSDAIVSQQEGNLKITQLG